MSWWSRFAPCTGGRILRSHQQGNLSTKCPFYLKSQPNRRKEAISEYDKKQRISKDEICEFYYVINGRPVLIFLGELYIFLAKISPWTWFNIYYTPIPEKSTMFVLSKVYFVDGDVWPLREDINRKNIFLWALSEWGGGVYPCLNFFGPFSRSAFLVNKKSLLLQKCQCIELLSVF